MTLLATGATVEAGRTASVRLAPTSLPAGETISVSWATSDGTAFAGGDYSAASGRLDIGPAGALVEIPTTAPTVPLAAATARTRVLFVAIDEATSSTGRDVLVGPNAAVLVVSLAGEPAGSTTSTSPTAPTTSNSTAPPTSSTPTTTTAPTGSATTPPTTPTTGAIALGAPTTVPVGGVATPVGNLPETGHGAAQLLRLAALPLWLGVLAAHVARRRAAPMG